MTNEIIAMIENAGPEALAGVLMASTALIIFIAAIALIRYLMQAIGYSKMYRKAGVAGWKAFIPVYSDYNNYKISWNGKFFFLSAAMYILLNVLRGGEAMGMQMAALAVSIALIVVMVKQNVKMAKLFGKGTGTGIALMLFPGITSLILGLGKAEFQAIAE